MGPTRSTSPTSRIGPATSLLLMSENGSGKTTVLECMATVRAQAWHRTGFRQRAPGRLVEIDRHDDLVQDLRHHLTTANRVVPEGLANPALSLPTALYFPACRDIPSVLGFGDRLITQLEHWGYSSTRKFSAHGTQWTASLDNLLVWLAWLSNGSFEEVVKTVNETVFNKSPDKFLAPEIRRVPPEAMAKNAGQIHRLDRLSNGERT